MCMNHSSCHTHMWIFVSFSYVNGSKYDWIRSSIFIFVLFSLFLLYKGDIIYKYMSLHLKIWDFLTLVNLARSIFTENWIKFIMLHPIWQQKHESHVVHVETINHLVHAHGNPTKRCPTWLSCFCCQIGCLQCVKCMDLPLFKSMVLFFTWDALVSSLIFIP